MNKNRSVVIVRYNDAIDGVLCKERHFVGIDRRYIFPLSLFLIPARICSRIDMHCADVFGASVQQLRLCSNFGWSNALRFQFIYSLFSACCSVCACVFLSLLLVVHLVACQRSYAPSHSFILIFISLPALFVHVGNVIKYLVD